MHPDSQHFTDLICGADPPTIQVFADAGGNVRPEHRTDPLPLLWPWINRQQAAGAGVFLTVNRTRPGTRKADTVDRVRALFIDCDGVEPGEWHLPPSLLVQSAHGKHAYWLVGDCPLDRFTPAQKRLATLYGSDPKVHDLPRVMRLPGTLHQKGLPQRVALLADSGHRYTYAEITADLPPLPQRPAPTPMPRYSPDRYALRGDYSTLDLIGWFAAQGAYLADKGDCKHTVVCPWWTGHTGQRRGESSTVVWQEPGQWPRFYCSHAHCNGRKLADIVALVGHDALAPFCAVTTTGQHKRAERATASAARYNRWDS